MEAQLELLETEAESMMDEVRHAMKDADSTEECGNAEEVLVALQHIRVEAARIRSACHTWTARASSSGRSTDPWSVVQATAPTVHRISTSDDLVERLDAAELKVWRQRIDSTRDIVTMMRQSNANELKELEKEAADAATYRSAPLLNPAIPSLPGAPSSGTLSYKQCLEDLAKEMARDYDDTPFTPLSVDERRLQVLDVQLQLQIDCRRLEPKLLENEEVLPAMVRDLGIEIADRTSKLSSTIEEILFARHKVDAALILKQHPPAYPQSEAARSQAEKQLASRNAQEGFQGHIKEIINRMTQLRTISGMSFEMIPGDEYALGCDAPLQRLSIYPVCGSVDHEARLDRRTPFWLKTGASKKKAGLQYQDGPQHFAYCGKARTARLHAYHLSKHPVTIGELQSLLADRRFSGALSKVVPPAYRAAAWRPAFHLQFLGRALSGFQQMEVPHSPDDVLEVPYFVAEDIASVLGGVVCPFDVWEAGGRGAERDPRNAFLFTDVEANQRLAITRKGWISTVDEDDEDPGPTPRQVHGEAIRLKHTAVKALECIMTPLRLERYGRCGVEWNSALRATDMPSTNEPCSGAAWAHSTTPSDLSILQSAHDEVPAPNDALLSQSFALRDSSSVAAAEWAPDNVEFVPTSHVFRSTADYGTQHIIDGSTASELCDGCTFEQDEVFMPQNERSFVGTALYTFGLPQRGLGGPVGGFRVAFPAYEEGAKALAKAVEERDAACGRDVTFLDLVGSLGKQRKHVAAFSAMLFTDVSKDPLYHTAHYRFAAAGFDVVFAAEVPHAVEQIDMYGAHHLSRPGVFERRTFPYPIATDRTPAAMLLMEGRTLEMYKAAVVEALGDGVAVNNDLEFTFYDTVELPPQPSRARSTLVGPRRVAACITWTIATLLTESYENIHSAVRCTIRLRPDAL